MASAFWDARKGKWYARFKNNQGRHCNKVIAGQESHPGPTAYKARGALTEKEANRRAAVEEDIAEKQRLKMLPMPGLEKTLGQVQDLWWQKYGRHLKSCRGRAFSDLHLKPLFGKPLGSISIGDLTDLFQGKVGTHAPDTLNLIRAHVHRLYVVAAEVDWYLGKNPAKGVKRFKVPKRLSEYLRYQEVPQTFAVLAPKWRGFFWTAVLMGLRRGELFAIRKVNVDRGERTIAVKNSLRSDITKGGHEDLLPIPAPLWPWIEEALKSPGPLLFPREDGSQYNRKAEPDELLRSAMRRAGIVTGWRFWCMRCISVDKSAAFEAGRVDGKGRVLKAAVKEIRERHTQVHPDDASRFCPDCKMRMRVTGISRHVRFHDLRHTTGTLLMQMKVHPRIVQEILRHSSADLTARYLHVDMGDKREGLATLWPTDMEPEEAQAVQAVAAGSTEFAGSMLSTETSEGPMNEIASARAALSVEARKPGPPSLGDRPRVAGSITGVQHGVTTPSLRSAGVHRTHQSPPERTQFAAVMLSSSEVGAGVPFHVMAGRFDSLLSVPEVARRLGVASQVVYGLLDSGVLPFIRLSRFRRIRPADLEAFIAKGGAR